MKRLIYPITIGLLFGVAGFLLTVRGYAIYLYYSWILLLFLLAVISAPSKAARTVTGYFLRMLLIAFIAVGLTAAGLGVLILQKQSTCRAISVTIACLENHRSKMGAYPSDLAGMDVPPDLRLRVNRIADSGISLEGIDECDAVFYLLPDRFLCVVPITKTFPISITRFYVYQWASDDPHWRTEKIVWLLGSLK